MKVTGSAVLRAPRDDVWRALNDPAVLVRTIPGCQRLEETGPDEYRMTVTAGVGTVKGTYTGEVRLAEQQEPESFVLRASGAGAPGTVSADVRVALTDGGDNTTRLDYDADAIVGGMIGGVGQRMLIGVAKKTAGEFFTAINDVLTGVAPELPVAAAPAVEAPGVPVSERPGPAVYEAPAKPPTGGLLGGDFGRGALVGATIAIAGVVVGAWIGGRRGLRAPG